MSSYLAIPNKHSTSSTVKPGTLIISCKPFAYTLTKNYTQNHCDCCFKKSDSNAGENEAHLSRCGGCQLVRYCDRNCQKKGWGDGHRWECKGFKKFGKLAPAFSRLLLRVIVKLRSKSDIFDRTGPNSSRRFQDLMSHYTEVREDATRMEHIYTSAKVVESLLTPEGIPMPDVHELIGLCGKIYVNTFSITDPELHQIGSGLYLGASIFNHSCEPMACATFQSTTIYIRSIVEYPENLPIEKVTISYQDTLRPSSYRIPDLRGIYYFKCQCERCSVSAYDSDMSAVLCQNKETKCDGEMYMQEDDFSCKKCKQALNEDQVFKIQEAEEMVRGKLHEMQDVAFLDVCETCINVMKTLQFSDTNWLMTNMASQAFDSSLDMSRWENAYTHGHLALKGYRKYLSPFHPFLGIALLKLAKLSWYLEKENEAKNLIVEAKPIIDITHGPNSQFSLTQVFPLLKEITMHCKQIS